MLDRQKGRFVFECDRCDEVLETDTSDFQLARDTMKAEGWRSRKNKKDEWDHFCPKCA